LYLPLSALGSYPHEIYADIMDMRAKELIQFKPCIPGILDSPAEHMRMVCIPTLYSYSVYIYSYCALLYASTVLYCTQLCSTALYTHQQVWHFAGSCAAGKVVDAADFSVLGTRGLHIADMSVSNSCPDGGAMGMAYLTGHLAAAQMHAKTAGEAASLKTE
jgi:hypothetical protein